MAEISWLRGGGVAGRMVSASDWSGSALGEPAQWSPALRTSLNIALQSPSPILLIWGDARSMLYNDAFAACIGERHPAAFGASLSEVLFWPDIRQAHEAAIEACFDGRRQLLEDQHVALPAESGQSDEAWFDFSYVPVFGADGVQVEGVMCAIIDSTRLPRVGRRMPQDAQRLQKINRELTVERDNAQQANRELSAETRFVRELLEQSPSFMAVVRGPEHVFEMVNRSYFTLFGDRPVIGRPAREAFPQLLDEDLFELLDRVYRSGETYTARGARLFLRRAPQPQSDRDSQFSEVVLDFVFQPMSGADGKVEGIFIEGFDVTERFAAEERLRIADSAGGIGIFEWFPDSGKLLVSDRFRQLWGLPHEGEVTADSLVSMIAEEHRPQLGIATIKDQERRNPLEYTEYRITRPDGQTRWLARKGEVVRDDPRTDKRYVGVVFDVTARKMMEQALAASEASVRANNAFVRQLLDSTDQGFYSIDRNGLVTLCNAAFLRMLGFSSEKDVLGRAAHEVIHHSHPDGSVYALADSPVYRAARDGVTAQVDNEVFFRADGSSFPVQYQAHPVWQDGVLQGALCTFVDLTEQRRGMQALLWSENRLTAIFNQASVCFSELDLQGRYLRVNDALCRMLCRTEKQLMQMTLAEVTHPEDVPMNMAMFNRCIEDGKSFTLEKRYVRPDGSTFWVSSNISRIVDAEGRPQAMIAVSTDITERRRAEEALRELNDTLEQRVVEEILERSRAEAALGQMQKMEAVGQLTGGVAHDFNNVLQIIGGNLQLLQSDPSLEERSRQRVKVAIGAVDRGAKLSSQLLAFARRQPLQPRSINLERVVQNMDDLLRRAVGETIEISTVITHELWNTMLDPNQVENLIINTAINARDAMPSGGRLTLQIDNVHLSDPYFLSQADLAPGEYVELAISDNGHGMSPEVRERAFEPFFTTKKEGEGTGLGLSMAYGFVKQSKGHISIHSEPGHGTTIRIYFPRSREHEVLIDDNREMEVRGGDETILVVEDDPNLQLTVIDTLASLGYRVLKADNGERALAIVQSGIHIDMVFTDVVMPGSVPATELARQARQLLPGVEVLFTSGYPRDAIVHEGRLDAGVELLSKPYRINQLARRIRHMLSNRAHHEQLAQSAARKEAPADASGAATATIHVLPVAERQRKAEQEPAQLEQAQAHAHTNAQAGYAASNGAAVPPTSSMPADGGLRLLVVEDNIDSQQLVCELLETLGHAARGVTSGEEAEKALGEQTFDVLFTDVNLPGISGVDLARNAVQRFPDLAVIFASGYGAMVARNVGFASHSLPKPYDIDQLQDILKKIATAA
ncbi:PAS domain S-box protein [Herbaspirillum sp. LeCh32-8]|uniref:hybrid sensor histidine kinase/response regulator n=1 Tax=Herbaspirillum sp. LeCh32-8 TaxID=2821356 RepID=UPI001AE1EC10|nr:PAS domain S-box protein [Herbaspirillum sp. LeCh32-8]MBP0597451.1 PAS domain S-box protein [Herbaspirillum sp. LeCh32-8]